MTIDDNKSVYVGGLPYDCSESQLRRAFDLYGSIIAVKIINDRGVGGKCYGFVTFKNPRSAIEAIDEMDGHTIGGRVVRVNGVRARGAGSRSNFGHDSLRRDQRESVLDYDRGRGRERENNFNKDRQHDNSLEHDGERERRHDNFRDRDQSRDYFQGRGRGQSRDLIDWERDRGRVHSRNCDRKLENDKDLNSTQDRELDRVVTDHDKRVDKSRALHTKRKNSSSSHDRHSRDLSSESSDYQYQMEEQLDMLIKRREELQKEKSDMEQSLEEKKQLIADLEKRSQKLEDLLTSAKKQSSVRQMRLTKLHKGFQEVKECGEKLKSSEEKLQKLVDSVSMEIDAGAAGDLGAKDVNLTNSKL
ncbi:zinc finger CCCH domain-containing protein 25-like [Chenopodium quinoa]|uniref:zinc finger CCCH domain-containing protein 25-like n=1 Tax=Chenopodium quinoa TaxID=63459 RepID=UPI000B7813D0|nr:zinc finger CCCH domain-containing protein 25-like [Chenopodium quinoa]